MRVLPESPGNRVTRDPGPFVHTDFVFTLGFIAWEGLNVAETADKTLAFLADRAERRAPERLQPYERNAKRHPDEQVERIAASIEQWGFTIPLLVDERDMVIAGHGRVLAAIKLELPEIP